MGDFLQTGGSFGGARGNFGADVSEFALGGMAVDTNRLRDALLGHPFYTNGNLLNASLIDPEFITVVSGKASEIKDPKDLTRIWAQAVGSKQGTLNGNQTSISLNATSNFYTPNAAIFTSVNGAGANLTAMFIVSADSTQEFLLELIEDNDNAYIADTVIGGGTTKVRIRSSRAANGLKAATSNGVTNDALAFLTVTDTRNAATQAKAGSSASVDGDVQVDLDSPNGFATGWLFSQLGTSDFYGGDFIGHLLIKGTRPTDAAIDAFVSDFVNPYIISEGHPAV